MPGEDAEDNYTVACGLVTRAVEADEAKDYNLALDLYSESLQYFVPILHYETDAVRRARLKMKVDQYVRRAEEVKRIVEGHEGSSQGNSSSQSDKKGSYRSSSASRDIRSMSVEKSELSDLCRVTPKMATGVEICESGDIYHMEGDLNRALDRWTAGLGVLVPILPSEPKGRRRDLLHTAITEWMVKAEKVKEALNVQQVVMEGAKGVKTRLGRGKEKKVESGQEGEEEKLEDCLDGKQCGLM